MLPLGTAVCWQAARKQKALRGRIVAVVNGGTAPAQAAPELIGLKTTQSTISLLVKMTKMTFGKRARPIREVTTMRMKMACG